MAGFYAFFGLKMDFKRILAVLFLMLAVPCLVAEEASGASGHLIQVFPSFSELIVGGGLPFLGSLPPNAVELFKIGPLPVTNSMVDASVPSASPSS